MKKKHCYEYPRPSVSVDIVLFRGDGKELEVLLIQRKADPFKGRWALPGGFVDENEALQKAAERELKEETGVARIKLRQVAAFGDPGRDPRGHTVTIAFTGRMRGRQKVKGSDDAAAARWFPVAKLPAVAFDHRKIIKAALAE